MSLEEKFQATKELGFDGIEILVTHSADSRSYERIEELSAQYALPVISIHAPTLVLTHFVWGPRPFQKLRRAAEHAAEVGAETVVVHPPYKLQRDYSQLFLDAVRKVNGLHGVHIAVENMYPWIFGPPLDLPLCSRVAHDHRGGRSRFAHLRLLPRHCCWLGHRERGRSHRTPPASHPPLGFDRRLDA